MTKTVMTCVSWLAALAGYAQSDAIQIDLSM